MNSLLQALFSPRLAGALLLYGVLVVLLELASHRLLRAVEDVPVTHWLMEHLGRPWLRALAMIIFVAAAYPTLFGLSEAPSLNMLLGSEDGRLSLLLNTAFFASLLLPLLPGLDRAPGLVLPLQAMASAALLFHWLGRATGLHDLHFWPGWGNALAIVILAALSQPVAHAASHWLGAHLNRLHDREGFEHLCYDGLLLVFQVPAILIFTLGLGAQLSQ